MNLLHCQKDYTDNTITVFYEGKYNKEMVIEYVKQNYSDINGEILEICPPTEYNGLKNDGMVLLK